MKQDRLLAFVANELQLAALAVLVLVYALKVRQIVKLPMPADTAPPRGSAVRGVARSFVRSLAPGGMESTSRHRGRWLAFALYHLGILAAIIASFLIPLARWTLSGPVRATVALLVGVAAGAGLLKLWCGPRDRSYASSAVQTTSPASSRWRAGSSRPSRPCSPEGGNG